MVQAPKTAAPSINPQPAIMKPTEEPPAYSQQVLATTAGSHTDKYVVFFTHMSIRTCKQTAMCLMAYSNINGSVGRVY